MRDRGPWHRGGGGAGERLWSRGGNVEPRPPLPLRHDFAPPAALRSMDAASRPALIADCPIAGAGSGAARRIRNGGPGRECDHGNRKDRKRIHGPCSDSGIAGLGIMVVALLLQGLCPGVPALAAQMPPSQPPAAAAPSSWRGGVGIVPKSHAHWEFLAPKKAKIPTAHSHGSYAIVELGGPEPSLINLGAAPHYRRTATGIEDWDLVDRRSFAN